MEDHNDIMTAIRDALACRFGGVSSWDELSDYDKQSGCYCNGTWMSLETILDAVETGLFDAGY